MFKWEKKPFELYPPDVAYLDLAVHPRKDLHADIEHLYAELSAAYTGLMTAEKEQCDRAQAFSAMTGRQQQSELTMTRLGADLKRYAWIRKTEQERHNEMVKREDLLWEARKRRLNTTTKEVGSMTKLTGKDNYHRMMRMMVQKELKLFKAWKQEGSITAKGLVAMMVVMIVFGTLIGSITAVDSNPGFTAYDCERPAQVQVFQTQAPEVCNHHQEDFQFPKESYALITRKSKIEFEGHSCEKRVSSFYYACGMFSHVALVRPHLIDVLQIVSIEECEKWVAGEVTVDGHVQKIEMDSEVVLTVDHVGTLYRDASTIRCIGESINDGDGIVEEELTLQQHRFILRSEKFLTKRGRVLSNTRKEVLKCHYAARGCAGSVTFIWDPDTVDSCLLRLIRYIEAETHVDQEGRKIVIDHESKVRLELTGQQVPICGLNLESTNYPEFFILPRSQLQRELEEVSSVRLEVFIASRDDYLAEYVESFFQEQINHYSTHACTQKKTHKMDSTLQRAADGNFVTERGEVVYSLVCPAVSVQYHESQDCFEDVPVLVADGRIRYMTAGSRVLKAHSALRPCAVLFPPLYLSSDEGWYSMEPSIEKVSTPKLIPLQDPENVDHLDMSFRGGDVFIGPSPERP